MNTENSKKINYQSVLIDLLSFAIGLFFAFTLKWKTQDFVWSLWLSSLVVGYASIITAIVGLGFNQIYLSSKKEFSSNSTFKALAISLGLSAFLLGFFSLHFCGFHAGHAAFLSAFFPINGITTSDFGDAFANPFKLWKIVADHIFTPYGMFLIPVLISERNNILKPLGLFKDKLSSMEVSQNIGISKKEEEEIQSKKLGEAMFKPYANVVRMHLLIFFFAFCFVFKIDSFIIYAAVYFVYFFPWKEFQKIRKGVSAT